MTWSDDFLPLPHILPGNFNGMRFTETENTKNCCMWLYFHFSVFQKAEWSESRAGKQVCIKHSQHPFPEQFLSGRQNACALLKSIPTYSHMARISSQAFFKHIWTERKRKSTQGDCTPMADSQYACMTSKRWLLRACVFERQTIKCYSMGTGEVEVRLPRDCWQESFVKGSPREEQWNVTKRCDWWSSSSWILLK